MSVLALAADAVSAPDWAARWLGILSLGVSVISVVVTVTLWRREGWRIVVMAPKNVREAIGRKLLGYLVEPSLRDTFEFEVWNLGRTACPILERSTVYPTYHPDRESEGLNSALSRCELTVARDGSALPYSLAPEERVRLRFECSPYLDMMVTVVAGGSTYEAMERCTYEGAELFRQP